MHLPETRSAAVSDCDPKALIEADEARRVWRGVLRQMWLDAGSHDAKRREAVRLWLGTADFVQCCDWACFTPSKVARELRRQLATPIETRFNRRNWTNARRARQRKLAAQAEAAAA